jgi:hypothetical protein
LETKNKQRESKPTVTPAETPAIAMRARIMEEDCILGFEETGRRSI